MNLDQYQKRLKKLEALKSEADRTEGKLDQLKERLKNEFDCTTVKQARAKYKQLESDYKELTEQADKAAEKFDQEFGEKLNELK